MFRHNVINRALKYKKDLPDRYNNKMCPSCNEVEETIFHLGECGNYDSKWISTSRRILSIVNTYNIMSKHDEWNEDWFPFSRKIEFFPTWFEDQNINKFYKNFNKKLGKLGFIPDNIYSILETFEISKKWRLECTFQCYLIVWQTMRKCWIERCKIFSK